jgi:hypothetical protein
VRLIFYSFFFEVLFSRALQLPGSGLGTMGNLSGRGWDGNPDCLEHLARNTVEWGAQHVPLAVMTYVHFPHPGQIPKDVRPFCVHPMELQAAAQLVAQHQREEAHEDVTSDRRGILMEDRARLQQNLGRTKELIRPGFHVG